MALAASPNTSWRRSYPFLSEAGIVTTVRKTRGDDIDAACGQLAGDVLDRTRAAERMAQRRSVETRPVQLLRRGA